MVDTVIQGKTRKRHEFCAFYTNSDPILTYMIKRLRVEKGDSILEPCAGNGAFIDKIIATVPQNNFTLDAMDLNPKAVAQLQKKFSDYSNISVKQADVLLDPAFELFTGRRLQYTRVVGNPPYGAWQTHEKRKLLKKLYGGYVRETYALFIRRCCDLLRKGGRLVFIVPDTFLALNLHKSLRRYLLTHTIIEEILLIPSSFFPGINFGYSNLCIITLVKSNDVARNRITLTAVKSSVEAVYEIAAGNYDAGEYYEELNQRDVAKSDNLAFMVGVEGNQRIREFVKENVLTLGDVADCVTGFYSGNNQRFMAVRDHTTRSSMKYDVARTPEIEDDFLDQDGILSGLTNGKKYIPILKGAGTARFSTDTDWLIQWDKETVDFFKKDRKARFQNAQYYFREGIGVPMVRTRSLRAFLLGKRLFDQSVVGIFPKRREYIDYLLAFLNSNVCTAMLGAINHTSNNSANYLKRIPIIIDDAAVLAINRVMDSFYVSKDTERTLDVVNDVFDSLFGL